MGGGMLCREFTKSLIFRDFDDALKDRNNSYQITANGYQVRKIDETQVDKQNIEWTP